jgi:predicted TPR repeat methyltransferase
MNRRERRAAAKVRAADAGDEVERLFRLALDHHRRRAYGDAEAIYGKIYAMAPSHFGTLNGLGDIYLAQRRWGDAAKVFRQAVARDPGYAPALNNLGFALQSLGDLAEAIGHYRQAIASRPGYFDAEYNLANTLLALGRFDEAIACYRRALALQPNAAGAHNNLGNALRGLGRFVEAAAAYREALRCAPSLDAAYFSLATALARAGQRDEAIRCYEEYLKRDPADLYGARFGLAHLGAALLPACTSLEHLDHVYAARAGGWGEGARDDEGYQGARLVAAAAAAALGGRGSLAILDAGCGTGLVGRLLKERAGRLDGVDLSSAMLARAGEAGIYDCLEHGDLVEHLRAHPHAYDLVVSAATLIHFRDLAPVFAAAARSLREDGLLVFTVFPHDGPGVGATIFQCFAHSPAHIAEAAAAAGFAIVAQERAVHEYHHGEPVMALVVTLRLTAGSASEGS